MLKLISVNGHSLCLVLGVCNIIRFVFAVLLLRQNRFYIWHQHGGAVIQGGAQVCETGKTKHFQNSGLYTAMCSGAYVSSSDCIKILRLEERIRGTKYIQWPLFLKYVSQRDRIKKKSERRETVASVVWLSELRKQRKSELETEEKRERTMTNGFFLGLPARAACDVLCIASYAD